MSKGQRTDVAMGVGVHCRGFQTPSLSPGASSYGTAQVLPPPLNTMGPHPMQSQPSPTPSLWVQILTGGPFSNSLSVVDVLYCGEVTLSLVRVLKMLSACQRKSAPVVYVAYTIRSQDTGKLFITELGQFSTWGPPFCP